MHATTTKVTKKLFKKPVYESRCMTCDWEHTTHEREEAEQAGFAHSLFPDRETPPTLTIHHEASTE